MAIQFACPACQQPIEVDDEWADQTVSCPYCRRVVRAPGQSTLQLGTLASAGQGGPAVPPPPPDKLDPPPPPPPRSYGSADRSEPSGPPLTPQVPVGNPLATWSVVVGVLAWGMFVVGLGILLPIMQDIVEPILATRPATKVTPQEAREMNQRMQARFQDVLLNDPVARKHASEALLLLLAAEACGLTGLILGLIGATRRNARKIPAVAGLILSGVFLSAQCGVLTFMLASSG